MAETAPEPSAGRLALPQVTMCAATSVNVAATIRAMETCMEQVAFGACKLFTDADVAFDHPGISVVKIARIRDSAAYSDFVLSQMVDHVATSHCLVVQWDGHVIDATRWRSEFLNVDYIGASWPQFDDDHDVGNGGFSLRSRRLMAACRDPRFLSGYPEDVAICRTNRPWLEEQGMRFASRALADLFASERAGDLDRSFGYHGVFNMIRAIGVEAFWPIYRGLDDYSTIRHDFAAILEQVGRGTGGVPRRARMIVDGLIHAVRKRVGSDDRLDRH